MDIQSNALNLSASGTHDFSNMFDYRLRLKLSELLYNKARGSRNSEFEVAEDESDTRILFLKVYDNGSGTTVEMDREKTARKIRDDLKNEKSELKKILNEELGLFKHDDEVTGQENIKDEKDEIFRFEFTEDPDTSSTSDAKNRKGRWRKKRTKPDTIKNKPATEFVIDE